MCQDVGLNPVTSAPQPGFSSSEKFSLAGLLESVMTQIELIRAAADVPLAEDLLGLGFGAHRREALHEIAALARPHPFEHALLHFVEIEQHAAPGVDEMQAVFVAPPRADLLGQLEGFGAGGLELKLQSARRRFRA